MNLIQALYRIRSAYRPLHSVLFYFGIGIRIHIDSFPQLRIATIYVAQTYGGLSPQQWKGFLLRTTSITFSISLESNMWKANRSRSFPHQTTIPRRNRHGKCHGRNNFLRHPCPLLYAAGHASTFCHAFMTRAQSPVGQLVFSSETRSLNEIQDLALFKVRPMFASLAGVSAPPPFGGNQRTILIKADPERMRSYGLTPMNW